MNANEQLEFAASQLTNAHLHVDGGGPVVVARPGAELGRAPITRPRRPNVLTLNHTPSVAALPDRDLLLGVRHPSGLKWKRISRLDAEARKQLARDVASKRVKRISANSFM